MSIHKSSINYKNLIKDLVQMYPDDVSEVIVSELVANSLDSKADRIECLTNPKKKTLIVADNGKGMSKSQFSRYHDLAAGLKIKGSKTIGFAGLGAKISFDIARRVITETRSENFSGGSDWYFNDGGELVWEDVRPKCILAGETGTRVEVCFPSDSDFPYDSEKDLANLIRHHYLPILDERFLALYEAMGIYSQTTTFMINGEELPKMRLEEEYSLDKQRDIYPKNKKDKQVGFGFFGIASNEYPISESRCGVILCTHGKVIKSEFFKQYPGQHAPKILGVVEIPGFIDFLNTSKSDFTRPRGKGKTLENLLDPVRQEFKRWLLDIGVSEIDKDDNAAEVAKIEREISKIISKIPELSEFLSSSNSRKGKALTQSSKGEVESHVESGMETTYSIENNGKSTEGPGPVTPGVKDGESLAEGGEEKAKPVSRKVRTGPKIAFYSRPDQIELAWIEGNSIIINSGHSSYEKAKANPVSRTLHNLFSIGIAIQKLILSDENREPDFTLVDKMMSAWGDSK